MVIKPWQELYADKVFSPEESVSKIRNGQVIFVSSGAGEPLLLTKTLARLAKRFADLHVIQLTATPGGAILASAEVEQTFRYNTLYLGRGRSRGGEGRMDFTPMNLSELPRAIMGGVFPLDVALIQISPPDDIGLCSLGVSVDASRAAIEHASLVIAQVNDQMPVTMGDSLVHVEDLDCLVDGSCPLPEMPGTEISPVDLTVGYHVASLVEDGMTLHLDHGAITSATMKHLDTKKDLGIHTDLLTDDILTLMRSRAITNRKKSRYRGRTVASLVMGSEALYRAVDGNPHFEFHPIDHVAAPSVIAENDRMVSVITVDEIELTGLARVDIEDDAGGIGSLPSSMDFLEGARRSAGGRSILALRSTTLDGARSRITALSESRGVPFDRAKVDYVVTEYGIVNLYGLTIRERALALISIAHPRFRRDLMKEAMALNYVDNDQQIPPGLESLYPHQYEFSHTFEDGLEVSFRPLRLYDAGRLQQLFYALSPESRRLRYHGTKATLTYTEARKIAAVDYSRDMTIVGLVGPHSNPRIVAEGRYSLNPTMNMGEFDIVVHPGYRGRGLANFLANYLNKIAYARGLHGVYAGVIQANAATMGLLDKAWPTAKRTFDSDTCTYTVRFPPAEVERPKDSIVIYSGRFGDFSYGADHPFNPARARAALRLMREEGFLDEPWVRIEAPRMVGKGRLTESHRPEYIDALEEAGTGEWSHVFPEFGLGGKECPIFPGLFEYVRLYTSATLTGVDLIRGEAANVVFNPLGGFHHASRSHAEGFCYVNDVIAAIDAFLAGGVRVACIDIDAHHGNGVQDAYYDDERVLTVSVHQSGTTLYPWGGFETERGEGVGEGFNINIPLPEETDDEAYVEVFDRVVVPAMEIFQPTVIVAVLGADTHRADPLTGLSLTNNGMTEVMERMRTFAPHLLLLGGGGYDLQSTIRGWARMWAAANRIDALPDYLLTVGGTFMGGAGAAGAGIIDPRYRLSGSRKGAILDELDRIAEYHEAETLPHLRARTRVRADARTGEDAGA